MEHIIELEADPEDSVRDYREKNNTLSFGSLPSGTGSGEEPGFEVLSVIIVLMILLILFYGKER